MKRILCPDCNRTTDYSQYFGIYICRHCGWESENYEKDNKQRGEQQLK